MRDFDRPLEESGRAHARAVGKAIADAKLKPDVVLCSPAKRTRETWDGVSEAVGEVANVRFLEALYGSDVGGYLAAIRGAGSGHTVLVVGHNPMIAETADALAGDGDARALDSMRSRYPTSSLAVIGFEGPLAEVEPGAGTLESWLLRE